MAATPGPNGTDGRAGRAGASRRPDQAPGIRYSRKAATRRRRRPSLRLPGVEASASSKERHPDERWHFGVLLPKRRGARSLQRRLGTDHMLRPAQTGTLLVRATARRPKCRLSAFRGRPETMVGSRDAHYATSTRVMTLTLVLLINAAEETCQLTGVPSRRAELPGGFGRDG